MSEEIRKLRVGSDYSYASIENEQVDQFVQVGTLEEIESFHKFIMSDLYREEKPIKFEAAFDQGREIDKKYYILPLKRLEPIASMGEDEVRFSIDRELMKYVALLNSKGYKEKQVNILAEMDSLGLEGPAREEYLKRHILVK